MSEGETIDIAQESPDQPEVIALIEQLNAHLSSLYPAESCHFVDIAGLSQPNVIFLVTRTESGEAVGCGGILLYAEYAEIKRMFVTPEWRGLGIARRLLAELERHAIQVGKTLLRLETGIHQAEALRLYERAGFHHCPPFGPYTNDPLSLCMEKHLAGETSET